MSDFDVSKYRADIPAIRNNPDVVYLDSASTALRPQIVLDAMREVDECFPANVGRASYAMAERATEAYEAARAYVAENMGAEPEEIVFTANATDAINLVANGILAYLSGGDRLIVSSMEHHSNYVPWRHLSSGTPLIFREVPCLVKGGWSSSAWDAEMTDSRPIGIVALTAMSNVTGVVPPWQWICEEIHARDGLVLIDGSQDVTHSFGIGLGIDPGYITRDRDGRLPTVPDFFAFSGHKIGGPTGCGVLFGKKAKLDLLAPSRVGGGTVRGVSSHDIEWADPPHLFEGGTPPITQAIGLAAALRYRTESIPFEANFHEQRLGKALREGLTNIGNVTLLGGDDNSMSLIAAFFVQGRKTDEVGRQLVDRGFAIRYGHHCAIPYHRAMGIEGSVRASVAYYNTEEEVARFIGAVKDIAEK